MLTNVLFVMSLELVADLVQARADHSKRGGEVGRKAIQLGKPRLNHRGVIFDHVRVGLQEADCILEDGLSTDQRD